MNTNEEKLVFKKEVFAIVGAAMEVLNELGHGFHEKPYENGLKGINYTQQKKFDILYKGRKVGLYVPDLIAFDSIVVDVKAIEKITGLRVGVIFNFSKPTLEWERIVR